MTAAETDEFIGRESDCQALARLFAEGARLVTIVGPPGIGKTRLMREFMRPRPRQRTCFVDLAAQEGVGGLCGALSRGLGLSLDGANPSEGQLASLLAASGKLWLLLDNFEHLVESGSATVERWLAAAPDLKCLVTSRKALRLGEQRIHELGPLTLPSAGKAGASFASEGERLFIARARVVRPGYEPNEEIPLVAEIVRRLDGVPLAIELAAAQMAVLGTRQLARALARQLSIGDGSTEDGPHRPKTLRAAVASSWDLLSPLERDALAKLAVFRGGFDVAAARVVLELDDRSSLASAQSLVASLLGQSLLRGSTPSARVRARRFGMYDYLREFVVGAWDAADLNIARECHAAYYAHFAAVHRHAVESDPESLARLELEIDNLVAAWEFSIERASPDSVDHALAIALALDPVLASRGPAELRERLLDEGLAAAGAHGASPNLLAWTLRARAAYAFDRREPEEARADLSTAASILVREPDPCLEALLLADAGWIELETGHLAKAEATLEEALSLAEAVSAPFARGRALYGIGKAAEHLGGRRKASRLYSRATTAFREAGSRWWEASARLHLADAKAQLCDASWFGHAEAIRTIASQSGHVRLLGAVDAVTACALVDSGDLEGGEQAARRALSNLGTVGEPYLETLVRGALGDIAFLRGHLLEAYRHYGDAVQRLHVMRARRWEATFLARLAGAQAALGEFDAARASIARSEALNAKVGDQVLPALLVLQTSHVELLEALGSADGVRCQEAATRAMHVLSSGAVGAAAAQSTTVRHALRVLRTALDGSKPTSELPAWWIAEDGTEFQPPGAAVVSLTGRKVLRRLLGALARSRFQSPGEAIAHEDLIAAGWPGERIARPAALNRLNGAIAALRKFGLTPILDTTPGGYRLDDGAAVLISPRPRAAAGRPGGPRTAPSIRPFGFRVQRREASTR